MKDTESNIRVIILSRSEIDELLEKAKGPV